MITSLPDSPAAFAGAIWADIQPHYDRLAEATLDGEAAGAWLAEWSRLEELLGEAQTLAALAYFKNTADPDREAVHLRWVSEIDPLLEEQVTRLSLKLLHSGRAPGGLEQVLARFANQAELFRAENIGLEGSVQELKVRHQRLTGGLSVEWEGTKVTVQQAGVHAQSPDRAVREKAFRLVAGAYAGCRTELASIFDRMVEVRTQIAANAGFQNYRDFAHRQKNRFDYSPQDCLDWDQAVSETVVPAVARLRERRRQRLGLDRLRPWDLACDPEGREPLRPYTDDAEFEERAQNVFQRVSPVFGERFALMRAERLLDLPNRPGKRPGAFCTSLPFSRRPFVFGNAVGTAGDVKTLLHEMGHAFHGFEVMEGLPLVFQRSYGMEIAEVASMSMELLAAPYLGRAEGGYFTEAELRRDRRDHLETILSLLPHIASVDAFQHWIYTDGAGAGPEERDAEWMRIRARFESGVDWEGLEQERTMRWYQQQHIFSNPFYYIEYGLAQFGALQVWRNARRDQEEAVRSYRQALALGATRPLPELFAAAGARLIFDAPAMAELVAMVEEEIEAAG